MTDKERETLIAGVHKIFNKDIHVLDIVRLLPAIMELNLINLHIAKDADLTDEEMREELLKFRQKIMNTSIVEWIISSTLLATLDDAIPGSETIAAYIQALDIDKDEIIEALMIGVLSLLQIILSGDISFYEETLEAIKEEIPDHEYVDACLKFKDKTGTATPLH